MAIHGDRAEAGLRWHQGISPYAWMVLSVAAMGWMFDTMDQSIFNLVRQPSVAELLSPIASGAALNAATTLASSRMTAIFLIGWAVGGFLFGMVGDRMGRARAMSLTIVIYAAFTGLTGLTHTVFWYGVCRFLTALGVGGEFAAGASLVAEVFPNRSRGMALGTLQALSAVGNMTAALITLSLSNLSHSWRWVYVVGAIPALLVFLIRRVVKEPDAWIRAQAESKREGAKEIGTILGLFREPDLRRNTIAGTLLAVAGVGGLWGIGVWMPELTTLSLGSYHFSPPEMSRVKSAVYFAQQFGALLGMFSYALLSERTGRRPALLFFFILAFLAVEGTFHFLHDLTTAYLLAPILGFCAVAPFSAYAIYFPELFPTRLRATGCGFCYNCARLVAAVAPFALGTMAKRFDVPGDPAAGLRTAASIVAFIYVVGLIGLRMAPETKGKPLPV